MTTLSEDDAARLQEGVAKHEQTTLMAEQAAKTAMETRDAARATVATLHGQEMQMHRLQDQYNEVEGNVNRAEGLVSWLTACCCCTCCVRDKQYIRAKEVHAPMVTAPETVRRQTAPSKHTYQAPKKVAMPSRIGDGLGGPVEDHLKNETNKQDGYIDTVEEALDDLNTAARDMNAQLKRQQQIEERLANRNAAVHGRIDDMRRKMQQNM
eukprot:jgi/Ulvmu1/9314/UM050_0063.1